MILMSLKKFPDAIVEMIRLISRNRQLTIEMAKREISDRYVGQFFGLLWAVVHPLMLMMIYFFLFGIVFKARVGGMPGIEMDYATYMLSGLIPWLGFQDALTKSPTIIINNASLVKQVVFPLEVLPVKAVLASLFSQCVSAIILIAYTLIVFHRLPLLYSVLPLLMVFQVAMMIGLSYILSAAGSYFRDLKDFVMIFCLVTMYLMPIFYLPGQVPAVFKPVLYANPFSHMIWCYQDVCFFGKIIHPASWIVFSCTSLLCCSIGFRVFKKLKGLFGNIL